MARKRRRFSERGMGTWVEQWKVRCSGLCFDGTGSAIDDGWFHLFSHLVGLSSFLYAGQTNDGFTVLQTLVKDHIRVALDGFLFRLWSFVVFLHLLPLDALQGLEGEWDWSFFWHKTNSKSFTSQRPCPYYLCQDLFGQNLISVFHHHVDKFTEKKNNMDKSHMTWPPVAKRDQTLSLNPWFYLRTGSLKTELVIPLGAALMGLSPFSSRSSFSSGLNSVMGVLYTSFLTSGSR